MPLTMLMQPFGCFMPWGEVGRRARSEAHADSGLRHHWPGRGGNVGRPDAASCRPVHEAHVAAEVIAGELQGNKELAAAAFNACVIPSVAYTDPEVSWGGPHRRLGPCAQGIKVKKGLFP